jgi:hypothetical protein
MSDSKVVSLYSPSVGRPEKANPALPDHIWDRFQDAGEAATAHLERLLSDPRFAHFEVKDQMRIIETTFQRAYGSPDGSVRRHLHVHANPEDNEGFNALRELSRQAQKSLPEFRRPMSEDVNGRRQPVVNDALDADTGEDVPGDGD